MPLKAKNYAIFSEDAEKYEIYRYGYHGLSAGSIVNKLRKNNNLLSKIIICHIVSTVATQCLMVQINVRNAELQLPGNKIC